MLIQRRAELIEFTGWTIEQLRDQPRDEVREIEMYINLKRKIQSEKDRMDRQQRGPMTGPH